MKVLIFSILLTPFNLYSFENKKIMDEYDKIANEIIRSTTIVLGNRIAVLPFSYAVSSQAVKDGIVISERITMKLINSGFFEVIERTQIEKVLNELKIQNSGVIDTKTAKDLGKILGVDLVVVGSLIRTSEGLVEINGRVIDVKTAKAIRAFFSKVKKDWKNVEQEVINFSDNPRNIRRFRQIKMIEQNKGEAE